MSAYNVKIRTVFSIAITVILMVSSQIVMADQSKQSAKGDSAGEHGKHEKNKNIGVGNASDGIKGRVITDKGIAYTGDPLSISLKFDRGSDLIVNGDVDAFVVIFAPAADIVDDSTDDTDTTGTDTTDTGTTDTGTTDTGTTDTGTTDTGTTDTDTTDTGTTDTGTTDTDTTDTGASDKSLTDAIVLPVNGQATAVETKLFELEAVDLSTIPAGTYQLGLILTVPGGDPLNINDWHNGLLGLVDIRGLTITDEAVDFDTDGDGEVDDDADGDGFSDDDDDDTAPADTASTDAAI